MRDNHVKIQPINIIMLTCNLIMLHVKIYKSHLRTTENIACQYNYVVVSTYLTPILTNIYLILHGGGDVVICQHVESFELDSYHLTCITHIPF